MYAAQFFTAKLAYYYLRIGVDAPHVLDKDGVVMDDSIGAVYGVKVVDIFKDGLTQLLVNDHLADGSQNDVFLFSSSLRAIRTRKVKRSPSIRLPRILICLEALAVGVGAPGFALPFDLNMERESKMPFKIGVAGDGNF